MTWEEIIIKIRTESKFADLVDLAYFEEELKLNIERFRVRDEYIETLKLIRKYQPNAKNLIDIGAGNGVASISFAMDGFNVTALEPDPSSTIGAGAIRILKDEFKLNNLEIVESFGEVMPFKNESFDVVYIRQAMHHANDLNKFINECSRILKKGGLFITVRDHVIYNENDKQWFLRSHPLHSFYGGENAFTYEEYYKAISNSGINVLKVFRHYDSVINYFPEKIELINEKNKTREELITTNLRKKFPKIVADFALLKNWYRRRLEKSLGKPNDESKIPGRLISFIGRKKS